MVPGEAFAVAYPPPGQVARETAVQFRMTRGPHAGAGFESAGYKSRFVETNRCFRRDSAFLAFPE